MKEEEVEVEDEAVAKRIHCAHSLMLVPLICCTPLPVDGHKELDWGTSNGDPQVLVYPQ